MTFQVPIHPGQIRWSRTKTGGLRAELSVGGQRFASEMTREELDAERAAAQDFVGFKISLGGLGKALGKIASPGGVLKLAQTASSVIDKVPGVKAALLATGPMGAMTLAGMAGVKALAKAKAGDQQAQAIVRKAEAVAALPANVIDSLPAPQTPTGEIVRYLVAIQRSG